MVVGGSQRLYVGAGHGHPHLDKRYVCQNWAPKK